MLVNNFLWNVDILIFFDKAAKEVQRIIKNKINYGTQRNNAGIALFA